MARPKRSADTVFHDLPADWHWEQDAELRFSRVEVRSGSPEAVGTFISSEKTRWAKVIKDSGIKFD